MHTIRLELNTGSTLQHNGDPQNTTEQTKQWLLDCTVFFCFFPCFYGEIPAAVVANNLLYGEAGARQTTALTVLRPRQFYAPVVPDVSSRGRPHSIMSHQN